MHHISLAISLSHPVSLNTFRSAHSGPVVASPKAENTLSSLRYFSVFQ